MTFQLKDLAAILAAEFIGPPETVISGVNTLDEATATDLSFLANPRYQEAMKKSKAGAICIDTQTPPIPGQNYLICENPSSAFQKIVETLHPQAKSGFVGIHPSAVIHEEAIVDPSAIIGPNVVIDRGVRIGPRTVIGPNASIGYDTIIGADCLIHANSTLREGCKLGDRVIIQPGAVIGSCGFGYIQDKLGRHIKLEQLGVVIIEDDVEIGANTTIDRSRFKATLIRKGTKIDNLCQIAHNVEVGEHNVMAAQTGIAGSSKTGKYVMLGGQVGILGHVELDDMVMVATRGGVSKSLKAGKYRGTPAVPINEYNQQKVHIRRLENYSERIKALEKKLQELEHSK
jgi:UDP-3-O-[3-hydroxymyristoyl] glucosamine N-acyltransferase